MKLSDLKTVSVLTLLFLSSTLAQAQTSENLPQDKVNNVELKVTGMTCAGCASHVYKVLSETKGIMDNEVKYPGDIAVIKYDPLRIQPEEIIEAIEEKTDFKAELMAKDES